MTPLHVQRLVAVTPDGYDTRETARRMARVKLSADDWEIFLEYLERFDRESIDEARTEADEEGYERGYQEGKEDAEEKALENVLSVLDESRALALDSDEDFETLRKLLTENIG